MLQTIDVLIGFTLVILIFSIIVTTLVQVATATLFNLKGRVLKDGVARLLLLLDKTDDGGLNASEARQLADTLLRNAIIGEKKLFQQGRRLAAVVHREELTKLVLDFAADGDLTKADATTRAVKTVSGKADKAKEALESLRAKLVKSLEKNGITAAGEILKKVRATMLELEQSKPEMASDARQTAALLEHASSEYLAKINAWFDQTMDRTVETFTTRARVWTIGLSAAVVIVFQINSFDLIKRLSVDQTTRQNLVELAISDPERFAPPAPASRADAAAGDSFDQIEAALTKINEDRNLKELVEADLIAWPRDWKAWAGYWTAPESQYDLFLRLVGSLLTVALLSLGAPVWYELLKNLIQLRSVAAGKDDAQRLIRQTSQ